MKEFNDKARALLEQKNTRFQTQEKTMIEKEQPVPELTPDGMYEVKKAHFKARLSRDHQRVKVLNEKAQKLYKKSLSELQQAAADQQRRSAGFNASADRTVLPPLNDNGKDRNKTLTQEEETAEKYKDYIKTISDLRRTYQGIEKLQSAASKIMTHMHDHDDMLKVAQDISDSEQIMQTSAVQLYNNKMTLEKAYPDFQAKANVFGKTLNHIQTKRKEMSW